MDDRIGVPLELEGFEVTDSEVVDGILEVGVRSTTRPACAGCGSVDVRPYDTTERRLRDRGCGYPVVLRWAQRRFRCRDCASIRRERHPQVPGRKRITNRFRRWLYEAAISRPFVDVALDEDVSLYRVVDSFDAFAAEKLVEPLTHHPRVISMDESAFRKRHRYHTVFSDPEKGVTFDLVPGRDRGADLSGLMALSDQVRANVETVVIDCHWPYRRAVEELLPRALLVADKFHVVKAVDAAADRIRKKHGRRRTVVGRDGGLARQHNPRFVPQVVGPS